MNKKIAVVRVRGCIKEDKRIDDTLCMLGIRNKNSCVILERSPSVMGMIDKVKDYSTWGDIDEATIKELSSKRKIEGKTFRLNPPKKGYGRKGIKVAFKVGGALGDRKEKINDLLRRMI